MLASKGLKWLCMVVWEERMLQVNLVINRLWKRKLFWMAQNIVHWLITKVIKINLSCILCKKRIKVILTDMNAVGAFRTRRGLKDPWEKNETGHMHAFSRVVWHPLLQQLVSSDGRKQKVRVLQHATKDLTKLFGFALPSTFTDKWFFEQNLRV